MRDIARVDSRRCFNPWLILALLCVLSAWLSEAENVDQDLHFAQTTPCDALFHAHDFPRQYPPRTHLLPVRIISSEHCPQLNDRTLDIRYYQRIDMDLRRMQRGELRVSPRADGSLSITLNHAQASATPAPWLMRWRVAISERIHAHYGVDSARWLNALLLGNRSELTAADRELLRRSGTSHLLAISGLHLGLITLLAYLGCKLVFAQSRRISAWIEPRSLALLAALAIAALFALLTGAHPPVLRAWLMFCGVAAAWFIPYLRNGLHGLAWAGILILVYDPTHIHHIGAWLSFMATAVVLLAYQRWQHQPAWRFWLLLQSAITLALLLPVWAIFGGVSVSSVLVNLLVIPWLAPLWVVSALGVLFAPLAALAAACLAMYLRVIAAFAAPDWAYITPAWQPSYGAALIGFLGILGMLFAHGKRTLFVLITICALLINYLQPAGDHLYQPPHQAHVALIHIGRDAYLLNSGYRHPRGSDNVARYLLPYMRRHRLQLRAVLLTSDAARDNTALQSIRAAYPDVPFYALKPRLDLPFTYQYCPENLAIDLAFTRQPRCSVSIGERWRINHNGDIEQL